MQRVSIKIWISFTIENEIIEDKNSRDIRILFKYL